MYRDVDVLLPLLPPNPRVAKQSCVFANNANWVRRSVGKEKFYRVGSEGQGAGQVTMATERQQTM